MDTESQQKTLNKLIAKCWADEGFKQRLLANPMEALKEQKLKVKPGLTVKAVENTDKVFHLVIPQRPDHLSEEELQQVSGGRKAGKGQQEYLEFKLQEVFVSSW